VLVSAHEATQVWNCKVANCEGEALRNAGPYAYLCGFHTDEAKHKRQVARYNGDASIHHLDQSGSDRVGKASHEFRAAGLVVLGRQLDEAMAEMEQAPIKLEAAQRHWDRAIANLADEICSPNVMD
jgi:hypothetical protein